MDSISTLLFDTKWENWPAEIRNLTAEEFCSTYNTEHETGFSSHTIEEDRDTDFKLVDQQNNILAVNHKFVWSEKREWPMTEGKLISGAPLAWERVHRSLEEYSSRLSRDVILLLDFNIYCPFQDEDVEVMKADFLLNNFRGVWLLDRWKNTAKSFVCLK